MKLLKTIIGLRLGTKALRHSAVTNFCFHGAMKNPLVKALILQPLIKIWEDNNAPEEARKSALAALGFLCDVRAWETLIGALERGYGAALALAELGDTRAVEPLIKALGRKTRDSTGDDFYLYFRRDAAIALGLLGDARAVNPLLVALGDEAKQVRSAAIHALGKLADIRAVEPLTMALGDLDPEVRRFASEALIKLGHMQWSKCIQGNFDDFKRLGLNGYSNAVKSLIKALSDSGPFRRDAVKALGELGDNRAVEPLILMLNDSDISVRESAAHALEQLADRRAVDPLLAALKFTSLRGKTFDADRFAEAIGMLGGVAELASLVENTPADEKVFLAKENKAELQTLKAVEWMAAKAVYGLEKCQQIDPLIKALKSRNTLVRNSALSALRKIGDIRVEDAFLNDLKDVSLPFKDVESLRNFGDDCSIRALVPLVSKSQQASRGELTKIDLEIILMRHACNFSVADLQMLMDARDYVYKCHWLSYDRYDGMEKEEAEDVEANLSLVRKLARQELIRRGLLS